MTSRRLAQLLLPPLTSTSSLARSHLHPASQPLRCFSTPRFPPLFPPRRLFPPFPAALSDSFEIKTALVVRLSFSTAAPASSGAPDDKPPGASADAKTEISQYWGIVPKEWRRADGAPWPWHCFRPQDTYRADTKVDVKRHYIANKFIDKLAYWTVKTLRVPVDIFFGNKHVSHALLLETVAAVPGMVGGMLLHFKSLRRFEHSGGWIKALLDEAENERMHLMTWVEVLKPNWMQRLLVLAVQGGFFNSYFLLYLISPRLSHRFVGYLEEEAVRSYTNMVEAIDKKELANGPAPLIAIDYWRLPKDATIRDVAMVIRADECHHRDVNHFAADVYTEKKELREAPL